MKMMGIPIVTGALGTIRKELVKGLEDLEIRVQVEAIQTIAVLKTTQVWKGYCLTLYFLRHRNELRNYSLVTHNNESFYLQLWGGLFLVLQDSWYLGLLVLETR